MTLYVENSVSEVVPVEGQGINLGMEQYPLLDLANFKNNWDEWEDTDVPMFFFSHYQGWWIYH